jgi:hypothetical protein
VLQVKRGIPYGHEDDDSIAVSYSLEHTSGLERDCNGRYAIIGRSRRHVCRSKVRDVILGRILRCAEHRNVCRFWTDKECSPAEDSTGKQTTTDSMDLLYRMSRHPIGLLAVILKTQSEVDYLQSLMIGHAIVRDSEDGNPRLAYSTISHVSSGIFDVLVYIHIDRWWTRAWILQEEYLSSTSMQILIQREPGLVARHRFSPV